MPADKKNLHAAKLRKKSNIQKEKSLKFKSQKNVVDFTTFSHLTF
jgi:hypothetical protein